MSNAVAQFGPVDRCPDGKALIRAVLGGNLGKDESSLIEAWAEGLAKAIRDEASGKGGAVCVLIDLRAMENYDDPAILDILAGLMKQDQAYVRKTATWGGNAVHEMIEKVIESMAGRDNLKNFRTEEEALEWLKA